jgi:AcrR family transcriptional regulator
VAGDDATRAPLADIPGRRPPDPEPARDEEVRQLIAATWAVAARTGNLEPSVRGILAQAGLSTKAFYRHFRSKDELLLVTLDEGTRLLVRYLEHRMAAHADPMEAIGAWIDGFVRQAVQPVAARRTLPWSLGAGRLATAYPGRFERNQAALVAPLARRIAAAVAAGSASSPDPRRDAWLIFGCTVETLRRHLIANTSADADTVAFIVGFARRALARRPPAPSRS